jgi:PKD repeat protein
MPLGILAMLLAGTAVQAEEVITEGNRVVGITGLEVINQFEEVVVYDVSFVFDSGQSVYGSEFNFTFTNEEDGALALSAVTSALNTTSPVPTRAGPNGTDKFFIGVEQDDGVIAAFGGQFFAGLFLWDQCDRPDCFVGTALVPADTPVTWAAFALSGSEPNQPPISDPGGPYGGFAGQEVTFDGSNSSDPEDGGVTSYDWDFGDDSAGSTEESPTHVYTEKGTYDVRLTVLDSDDSFTTSGTRAYIADPSDLSRTLLMRRTDDGRWTHYVIAGLEVTASGPLDLARSLDFTTVSRADFNGDLEGDLLLRDFAGGQNGRWVIYNLVDGQIADGAYIELPRNLDWVLQAVDDYDGDGRNDVLMRNSKTGAWLMYLLSDISIKQQGNVAMTADLTQTFKGSADFDGDGNADVLLRDGNGRWTMYLLNGLSMPVEGQPALPTNTAVDVVALDTFGGDSMADILTRRSTDGLWSLFEMDGFQIAGSGSVDITKNQAWEFVESADYSGDGRADVLLRQDTGQWSLYELDGSTILASGNPGLTKNPDFEFVEAGRYNGDYAVDILLRNSSDGRPSLYLMNGVGFIEAGQPGITQALVWQPVVDGSSGPDPSPPPPQNLVDDFENSRQVVPEVDPPDRRTILEVPSALGGYRVLEQIVGDNFIVVDNGQNLGLDIDSGVLSMAPGGQAGGRIKAEWSGAGGAGLGGVDLTAVGDEFQLTGVILGTDPPGYELLNYLAFRVTDINGLQSSFRPGWDEIQDDLFLSSSLTYLVPFSSLTGEADLTLVDRIVLEWETTPLSLGGFVMDSFSVVSALD